MAITRETLYEEVWAEPMTVVAARYRIFPNRLAGVCERLRVPVPPRGYWAKERVGKAEPRPPLPLPRPGDEVHWRQHGDYPAPARPIDYETQPTKSARRGTPEGPHLLVAGTEVEFGKGRVTDEGYLRPSKRTLPDIFVSAEALLRALEAMSLLLWTMEEHGHRVVLAPRDFHYGRPHLNHHGGKDELWSWYTWRPERPTLAFVGGLAFGLTLFELAEDVEVKYVDGKWVRAAMAPKKKRWNQYEQVTTKHLPSGRLCVRAYSPYAGAPWEKRWLEMKAGDLTRMLSSIPKELGREAPTVRRLIDEAARKHEEEIRLWEEQRKKWAIEAAERKRTEAHKESRAELLSIIQKWSAARDFESFFQDLERRIQSADEPDKTALLDRLSMARSLFGGTNTLEHFGGWLTPEERFKAP